MVKHAGRARCAGRDPRRKGPAGGCEPVRLSDLSGDGTQPHQSDDYRSEMSSLLEAQHVPNNAGNRGNSRVIVQDRRAAPSSSRLYPCNCEDVN